MRHRFIIIGLIAWCTWPLMSHHVFDLEESQNLSQVIAFSRPAADKTVVVDNVFGTITVIGQTRADVRLEGKKALHAESRVDMDRARREARLDVSEKENCITIMVNGPFRCANGSIHWDDRGYIAEYDLDLQVPAQCNLVLKTVNDGDILVRNVSGTFSVHNVNGKITMERIAGAGKARTVNGSVQIDFSRDPEADCSFATINGDIQVGCSPALAADFLLKTFNGDIFSDYPVTYLPHKSATSKRENGRTVYRSDRFQAVRIGRGGPELKMDTLNGDITIASKKK